MKYKLTALLQNNGVTTFLTSEQICSLIDGNLSTSGVPLVSGSELNIKCDLINRCSLSSIKYYYTGGVVVIKVSEILGIWSTVPTSYIPGGVSVSLISYNPRWINIIHSVSSGIGYAKEIEIYNDDTEILFGEIGTLTSYGIDSSGIVETEVKIYNNTAIIRDVYVFIDDSPDTDADNLLIYKVETGDSYIQKRERGFSLPRDLSWDTGYHINTCTDINSYLTLSGTETFGGYYSPVIDISSYSNVRFFWDSSTTSGISYNTEAHGPSDCIGLRRSSVSPSGTWSSGSLASAGDVLWNTFSGTLPFLDTPNNTILSVVGGSYIQFAITLSGSVFNKPQIFLGGVEEPLVISSIPAHSNKSIYITTTSGTISGKNTNLICWYKEM
jgi:hypothetical protein